MKLKEAILVFLFVGILLIFGAYYYVSHMVPHKTQFIEFDMKVTGGAPGFNLDKDKMHFGDVCIKCPVTRQITIRNDHSFPERINFKIASTSLPLTNWVTIVPSSYVVSPGKTHYFQVTASPSYEAEKKLYEGSIVVNRYKSFPWE